MPFRRETRLQLRAEAFNVLNHPQFAEPRKYRGLPGLWCRYCNLAGEQGSSTRGTVNILRSRHRGTPDLVLIICATIKVAVDYGMVDRKRRILIL
jgi:hypothetical protein